MLIKVGNCLFSTKLVTKHSSNFEKSNSQVLLLFVFSSSVIIIVDVEFSISVEYYSLRTLHYKQENRIFQRSAGNELFWKSEIPHWRLLNAKYFPIFES